MAAAAIVVVSFLVVVLIQGLRQQAVEAASGEFQNLARVFDEHVSRTVKLNDQYMLALRGAYETDPEHFVLTSWIAGNGVVTDVLPQIGIIDKNGKYIASSIPNTQLGIDLSDREHFQVHATGAEDFLYISKPVLGRASGKWTIQLTRRLRDHDGNFAGVIEIGRAHV